MAYEHVRSLTVNAWGRRVGVAQPSRNSRDAYAFQYDPDWISSGVQLAPVLMPLPRASVNRPFVFSTGDYPTETYRGMPPMLADSVPDAFGNTVINLALTQAGVASAKQITPLDRLAYVGSRGMGALTFEPDGSPQVRPTSIDLAELVESARGAVSGTLSSDSGRGDALRELIAVGTSAGGARAKAVIAYNPQTQEVRAGNLPVPEGFEQWLLKFDGLGTTDGAPSGAQGYTRVEYAYGLMARDAGMDLSQMELLHEGGRAHFMTRRFDRPGTDDTRLHMQSLCAIAAVDFNHIGDDARGIPSNRYEAYFDTIRDLGLDTDRNLAEAYRRMVFNVLASNCDDHSKNFSFLMDEAGQWSLAPAYDVTFAYDPTSQWLARHLTSVGGKTDAIEARDLLDAGKRYLVPDATRILRDVAQVIERWPDYADEAEVASEMRNGIQRRLSVVAEQVGARGL